MNNILTNVNFPLGNVQLRDNLIIHIVGSPSVWF